MSHRPAEYSTDALAALELAAGRALPTSSVVSPEAKVVGSESSDDGLPPLTRNNNRKVVEYYVSDDTDEE